LSIYSEINVPFEKDKFIQVQVVEKDGAREERGRNYSGHKEVTRECAASNWPSKLPDVRELFSQVE
jgi:hypothetical protein